MARLGRTPGNPQGAPRRRLLCGVLLCLGILSIGIAGCSFDGSATGQATLTPQTPSSPTEASSAAEPPDENVEDVLLSMRSGETPAVDGNLETQWEHSVPLDLPLTWGWEGEEVALRVEMRSLHNEEMVCFGARWRGQPPSGENDATFNKLTVHWQIPSWQVEDRGQLDCTVVCHTAFADAQGRISYMHSETIPQGGDAVLQSAGLWESGLWTVEWCRPLQSENPYDLQFSSLDAEYPFRVKIFESVEGRPDPVSGPVLLRFDI